MKLSVTLIRGGLTNAGESGKYLGRMEEQLEPKNAQGILKKVTEGIYPAVELVYTSAQLRCIETAQLIYPNIPAIVMRGLEDFDYGVYTGMKYSEIRKDEHFEQWAVNIEEVKPFEYGENPHALYSRGRRAFQKITEEMLAKGISSVGIVTHRIIISAILQRYYIPRRSYADWSVQCGGGITVEYNNRTSAASVISTF